MSAVGLGILESGVEIAVPTCEPGIGKVILSPTTSDLIADIQIKPFPVWPDDRGYFLEVARLEQGLVAGFPGPALKSPPHSIIRASSRRFTFTSSKPITGSRPPGCSKSRWSIYDWIRRRMA